MENPYTCDNCIFNPSQYRRLGSLDGYCLKHSTMLFRSCETTCRFHRRKDLPSFVCEEGVTEHASNFAHVQGVVFYESKTKARRTEYSERHAWDTSSFDPNLNEVSVYHRSTKKWIFLESFLGSGNAVKSVMHSSMSRRYIQQCGPKQDNYRIALGVAYELGRTSKPVPSDFRVGDAGSNQGDLTAEVLDLYRKDVELLKLYCLQEYGYLVGDDEITWVSDEMNGALDESEAEFIKVIESLGRLLIQRIISGAKKRRTYFQHVKSL